jgi:NCS1 family nucleobase:cation symporter-1
MPDFTRFAKDQKSQVWGQTLGLPTTMTFFSAIGVLITSATIVVYGEAVWDPVVLLAKPEFSHPLVIAFSLISISVATLSVNVAANVVSPAFDFANLWPEKINFKIGGTITGIIGIVMMPWELLKSAGSYIFTWLVGYSALLGPIAGIMICDFWVVRRKSLHIEDLYRLNGRYRYAGGVNPLAIIALVLGILPNLPGFILEVAARTVTKEAIIASLPKGLQAAAWLSVQVYSYAWLVGFAVAFLSYRALMAGFCREHAGAELPEAAAAQ